MPVHAKIFPNGLVRVAGTSDEVPKLLESHYLRRDGRFWKTWWTYAPDLRRDFPTIVFRDGSAEALRDLIARVQSARHGDDDRVRSWFSPETPPKPFQFESIHFGLNLGHGFVLADGVGLGKTIQATGIMLGAFATGRIRRAVICVPSSLKTQWFRELHDKANPRVLPAAIKIATGSPRARREIYRSNWRILILSHEICRIDIDVLEALGVARSVDLAILDEASVLKNGDGPTVAALHRAYRFAKWRIALTATPLENGLHDLYHIFRWVDRKVFMSKFHFNDRYVLFRQQHFSVKKRDGSGVAKIRELKPWKYRNLNEVKAKIRPYFIRRTAAEVGVQLPSVTFTREIIDLAPAQRKVYNAVRDRVKVFLEQHPELEGEALMSPIVALRQAADSPELVPEGAGVKTSSKVARLKELLDGELKGEQVLIFSDFEKFVRILMRELRAFQPVCFTGPMGESDRRASIDLFTRGKRRVLIGTKAVERGHNLQVAGVVVNADIPWNPAALKQRLGRLRRMESKHLVIRVRDLIAADTVEENLMLPKLADKHRLAEDVLGEDELSVSRAEPDHAGLTARNVRDRI